MPLTETVTVPLGARSYSIVVGDRILADLGSAVAGVAKVGFAGLVSDEIVWARYGTVVQKSLEASGFSVRPIILAPGEGSKTLGTVASVLDELLDARPDRQSVVVALGGGVVGDIAGFAAAICLRGITFVQVPTTIVAQVDASVGGKTGVDHPCGKNLIGAFHQPSLVYADTGVLTTLPDRDIRAGMAEVAKHAVIRDPRLFCDLEQRAERFLSGLAEPSEWIELIAANCRIKALVVSADERESGLREILNYGHTTGHAIELLGSYDRFRHGEAVAYGMKVAGAIAVARASWSVQDNLRQGALLDRVITTRFPSDYRSNEVWEAMRSDKKARSGKPRFVLPTGIGNAEVVSDVTHAEFDAAWSATIASANET
jgi:3-dehydroquinate synthase